MIDYSGQFLISMPSVDDYLFDRSVVYLCQHDAGGALGFIINKPVDEINIEEVYQQLDIPINETSVSRDVTLLQGGPVTQDRGFVIHPANEVWRSTIEHTPGVAVTTSVDILEAIGQGEGPRRALLCLGYAGWDPDQLDEEMKQNLWLTADVDFDTIFKVPFHRRWHHAALSAGINLDRLVQTVGHA